jgi:hypothetical protein
MTRLAFLFPAILLLAAALVSAQTASQDYSYTISTTQPWTDTGLDLQTGDVVQVSASVPVMDRHALPGMTMCDPRGVAEGSGQTGLPLDSARPGALIARLHAQGAMPLPVGADTELHIEEPSHLYLGVNAAGTAPCQGNFAVKVHKTSAAAASAPSSDAVAADAQSLTTSSTAPTAASKGTSASTPSTADAQSKPRSEQLKSQLSTAASIFMSGQFGMGKSETNTAGASNAASGAASGEAATPAPVLKLSDAPLDSDLRHSIDGLPRRVNDQFKNLGDMVNFVIVGSQKDVQAALDAANWHVADTDNKKAVLSALVQTYENKDYLQMPMSTLYLFDRPQDFGYEQAEPIAMVASRHHFRIWKTTVTWKGHEVWCGAGTHDIGFAKDKRNGLVTHKIDPAVDGERDNIGASLQKANKAKSLTYYLPPNPIQDAKNATGDGYHSDGRVLVIQLQ